MARHRAPAGGMPLPAGARTVEQLIQVARSATQGRPELPEPTREERRQIARARRAAGAQHA